MPLFPHRGEGAKEGSRSKKLSGLFTRSKSPAPAPAIQDGITKPEAGHHTDKALIISEPKETATELTVSDSAYRRAWFSLGDEQRKELAGDGGIRELFHQLSQTEKQHRDQSRLLKGLSAAHPYLERLDATLELVSPFASLEPTAGTALGVVRGAASIAISVCDAASDLTDQIVSFLERIPAIERCNDVVRDGTQMPDIYNALVDVYADLLRFYLEAAVLFKKSNIALRMTLSMLKPKLPEIISAFNTHADILSKRLESETFAAVQEIKGEQVDALIRDTLDASRDREVAFHNELSQRTNEACHWITSNSTFAVWVANTDDSKLLAMFGDMGSGKTMTTAYVADHLSQQCLVCAYYFKDDQTTTGLGGLYRSLLWQMLKRQPDLKARFWIWYKETEKEALVDPTRSDHHTHDLLYDLISSSKDQVFVILDGLDECDPSSQRAILTFFHKLFQDNAHLKVFISSRHDEDIQASLPPGSSRIEMHSSRDRDRIIARYLADQANVHERIRDRAVEELSAMTNGSIIWLRIALEFIGRKPRIQNERGLRNALERLPSSQGLAELYWKLFDKACADLETSQDILQKALEVLAVSKRPLTTEELGYAVFIDLEGDDMTTISELDEAAHAISLLELIQPFVSSTNIGSGSESRLRLVHQSLKELVLQAAPSQWSSIGNTRGRKQDIGRGPELNGSLLRVCIRYLLLDDCGENDLFSGNKSQYVEVNFLTDFGRILDEDDEDDGNAIAEDPSTSTWHPDFSPADVGLGALFAYAAPYWTAHLRYTPQELMPDAADMAHLCSAGSRRLANWVEQWQRPNCSYSLEFKLSEPMDKLDPLVITAMFGTAASMAHMLKCDLRSPDFLPDSTWTAVQCLLRTGSVPVIRDLVKDKTLGSTLCCVAFFYEVVLGWSGAGRSQSSAAEEWEEIFDFLIRELRGDMLDSGNEILCQASRNGCLVLVKKLCEAADHDAELRAAMLTPNRSRQGQGGQEDVIYAHQSVGEAAYEAHADVVRFLCQQTGIEAHVRHVNTRGQTVFHQAARRGDIETFEILLQKWPEGVNLRNNCNDTALTELIFSSPRGAANTTEAVKVLLRTGKVDASGSQDDEGYSPLRTAARLSRINLELCQVLVREGSADVYSVVGIDSGRPFLREPPQVPGSEQESDNMQLLKGLCRLAPIAVSTELLF